MAHIECAKSDPDWIRTALGGFDDAGLRPGKSKTGEWSILSRNAKKIVLVWPYEVVFEDGTKWEIGK